MKYKMTVEFDDKLKNVVVDYKVVIPGFKVIKV